MARKSKCLQCKHHTMEYSKRLGTRVLGCSAYDCEFEYKKDEQVNTTEEQAQADGEYISRNNAITSICQWGTTLERTGTYTITIAEMKQTIADMLCELPSVAIPPEHDGCENCRWMSRSETEMPCKLCMHNYMDKWEMVEPQEKRCEDCKHYGKFSLDCGRCDDDCSMYEPQESEEV